jgi:ribosome-binding factor A
MTHSGGARASRVAEQIRAELMELLLRGAVREPKAQGAVVSSVHVSGDLSQAQVYVRSIPPDGTTTPPPPDDVVAALQRASGFLRREVGKRLRIRRIPELTFRWDEAVDRAVRIEALLEEVRSEDGGATGGATEPAAPGGSDEATPDGPGKPGGPSSSGRGR